MKRREFLKMAALGVPLPKALKDVMERLDEK